MSRYVLDTHALLFFLSGSPRLGFNAKSVMEAADSELVLPAIALAEALWIADSRDVGTSAKQVLTHIADDPRITICAHTEETVVCAHGLTSISEMHDRQIAATTLGLDGAVLLTRDQDIVSSGIASVLW